LVLAKILGFNMLIRNNRSKEFGVKYVLDLAWLKFAVAAATEFSPGEPRGAQGNPGVPRVV
jgi:hypothetical protein